MRSIFFLAVISLLCTPLLSAGMNTDSLSEERSNQLQQLRTFQSSLPDSSAESLLLLIQKMDDLIIKDGELISVMLDDIAAKDTAMVQAESTLEEFEKAKTELATYEEYKQYAMIGGGVLVLIFLIIIIIQSSSKGKLKKKLKKFKKQNHEIEEKNTTIHNLSEDLESIKKDHKLAIDKLSKDHEQALRKKEEEIDSIRKENQNSESLKEELKKLKADLTSKELSINEKQREIDRQKTAVENTNQETERLKAKLAGINDNQISDLKEKEELISSLQDDIAHIKRENHKLELEMFHLRSNSQTSENSEEIQRLKEEVERAEKELSDSRSSMLKEIETLKIENEEIRRKLETEASIREEFAEKHVNTGDADVSSDENIEQLKNELAEERKLRLEMQALMEQIIKRQ